MSLLSSSLVLLSSSLVLLERMLGVDVALLACGELVS